MASFSYSFFIEKALKNGHLTRSEGFKTGVGLFWFSVDVFSDIVFCAETSFFS